LTCVRADLHRHYGRFGWGLLLRAVLFKRTFAPVFTLRLCQALDRGGWKRMALVPARLLHRWATGRAAIDLPWRTRIGPGLRIVHGFGLVVNEASVIGSNVTLFHGVTIGQRDRVAQGARTTSQPVIEGDVFLGAYAMVLGAHVGRGAVVAPMSVVINPVEPRTAVGGNPAKPIRHDVSPDVTQPWFPPADRGAASQPVHREATPWPAS
jgi:serine O-acetyltransferase